jgi:[pyruvate, water dikinase]-phosphate phosphotransferase / [pyruvate, water dikinase] kinase
MLTIFAVSDATGRTVESMVRSALAQFEGAPLKLVRRGQIRTAEQIRAVVEEAAGQEAIVFHTLVSHDLRRVMLDETRRHNVDSMDMMGPLLDRLATRLKATPQEKPGLFQQLTEAKTREIEAVAYAFRHDDGQNAHELDRAEVVLVGASRTMKTPTMLYLAYRGWFAANVPIVLDMPPPAELLAVPAARVFCLFMAPGHLIELRRFRARVEGIPVESYASLEQVKKELRYAEQLCTTHGWRGLDVTGKSVEELGHEIVTLLGGSRR